MLKGAPVIALVGLVGAGCEAQTTVRTPIVLASDGASATLERLHVQVRRAKTFAQPLDVPGGKCPPFDKEAKATDHGWLTKTPQGFEMTQSEIPSVPEFCAAAWYDANGNGLLDAGDSVGTFAEPYPSQPSTFFGSNRYDSPAIVLRPIQ
ncbi:MAG: hypothetical protein JNL21_40375 [Myxococcales bacterium]|nr:hypothetical protein [Myxococcales bacterium]